MALTSAIALLSGAYAARTRFAMRDRRFAGVAPGVVDGSAPVVRDTLDPDRIPVQFHPPAMPAAVGGRLLGSAAGHQVTAATLAELCHLGAITISAVPSSERKHRKSAGLARSASLRDSSRCATAYQQRFVSALFTVPHEPVVLDRPSRARARGTGLAATALTREVDQELLQLGWVRRGKVLLPGCLLAAAALICAFFFYDAYFATAFGDSLSSSMHYSSMVGSDSSSSSSGSGGGGSSGGGGGRSW